MGADRQGRSPPQLGTEVGRQAPAAAAPDRGLIEGVEKSRLHRDAAPQPRLQKHRASCGLRLAWGFVLAVGAWSAPVRADEVLVFAAASLTEALEEIGRAYGSGTGDTVIFSFGASSDLARQIRAGAPADVFFSADLAQMEALERAGAVRRADRVDLLSNVLVIVVPAGSGSRLAGPASLTGLKRIAVADPEAVPAGVYARRYLESLGLWHLLRDRVVPTLDVRAALAAVDSGSVEAAIVYKTDARISKRVRVEYEVPPSQGPPIVYPVAPLAASQKPAAGRFVSYLASAAAKAAFESHGFIVLERAPGR